MSNGFNGLQMQNSAGERNLKFLDISSILLNFTPETSNGYMVRIIIFLIIFMFSCFAYKIIIFDIRKLIN